jgi:hypothetical protein
MSALLSQLEGRERRAECLRNDAALNGGKTGWPPGMLQDDCRALSKWLANRIDSRMHAREAARAFFAECEAEARDVMRNRSEK